jgi:hypothetical protein
MPLPDGGGLAFRVMGETALAPRLKIGAHWSSMGSLGRGEALYGEILLGPIYSWVGRRAPGYGPGRGGGIVLSGTTPLNGIGFGMAAPGRLPWIFGKAGTLDFEMLLARGTHNGDVKRPLILMGRGTLALGPQVALSANRGIMFGGDGAPGLTFKRLFWILVGDHLYEDGEWLQMENQIASFDLVWRPKPGGVPLLLFLEWGMEDSAGAWIHSPGIVAGVEIVHPDQRVRVGVESTYLDREVLPEGAEWLRHSIWYRHGLYTAGWSDGGRLLGHPLGGPGREWLMHAAVRGHDGAWDVEIGLRSRNRISQNSFSTYRQGKATGGFLEGRLRSGPVDLYIKGDGERLSGGKVVGALEGGLVWRLGESPWASRSYPPPPMRS